MSRYLYRSTAFNMLNVEHEFDVLCYRKSKFEQLLRGVVDQYNVEQTDVMYISILNVGDDTGYFKKNFQNVLVLHFDDITDVRSDLAFNQDHAEQIIDFIIKNKYKSECMVHCSAGISRSGAVGQFINACFGVNNDYFLNMNVNVRPNPMILETLEEVFNKLNK